MFNKLKKQILYQLHHTNMCVYILLSIVSICCLICSLIFETNSKLFVILSALGCSGIVSVIVAALVENSNIKLQEKHDERLLNQLLVNFDYCVDIELKYALIMCENNLKIILNNEYSIKEIRNLINQIDSSNEGFDMLRMMSEQSIHNVPIIGFCEIYKNDNGVKLQLLFDALKKASDLICKKTIAEDKKSSKMIALCILEIFEEIDEARNKKSKYSISSETCEWLQEFRTYKRDMTGKENT